MSEDTAETEDDGESFDPRTLIKQLAPEQMGLFEPLSGLMLLNIDDAGFQALGERWAANQCTAADVDVIRTMNHEMYHFAQAAASGYVFHRQARAFVEFNNAEPLPEIPLEDDVAAQLAAAREEAKDDPELQLRLARMEAVLSGNNQLAVMEALAGPGDHSVMGAMNPRFFAHIKSVAEAEREPNADGLSITGLLEGSALLHSHLLMHPDGDAHIYVNAELATLPPVYQELVAVTATAVGERTLELALPATSLALHYLRPHEAYLPLLKQLAESPDFEGLAAARKLLAALPDIPAAGPVLGNSLDIRAVDDGYRIYDPVLDALRDQRWGIDCHDFLADPAAMHKVTSFPMGIVTADGYHGGLPKMDLVVRMVVMSAVLRVTSRRRAEKDFRQFQVDWARDVLIRLMNGMPDKN